MTTLKADEVRIPRRAREALAQHEELVVLDRERPAFVIVHPDDRRCPVSARQGRRLGDVVALLANATIPDPGFAADMEAVLDSVGAASRRC